MTLGYEGREARARDQAIDLPEVSVARDHLEYTAPVHAENASTSKHHPHAGLAWRIRAVTETTSGADRSLSAGVMGNRLSSGRASPNIVSSGFAEGGIRLSAAPPLGLAIRDGKITTQRPQGEPMQHSNAHPTADLLDTQLAAYGRRAARTGRRRPSTSEVIGCTAAAGGAVFPLRPATAPAA